MTDTAPRDNPTTVIAIGLLAYASADIAHHVLGHGAACLALGGHIISLSSVFVDCTRRGWIIDTAGPLANLAVGLLALASSHFARRPHARLFLGLAAGFNLLWFALQFAYSIATRRDDFAWLAFQLAAPWRYGLAILGLLVYRFFVRLTAGSLAGFSDPLARLRVIVWTAWLTAGTFAVLTALRDHHTAQAILYYAAPQSLLLSIGLLALPQRAARRVMETAPALGFSPLWCLCALGVAFLSILFLGPGFSFP